MCLLFMASLRLQKSCQRFDSRVFDTSFTFLSGFVIWMQGFLHIIHIFEWLCHLDARFYTYHSYFRVTFSFGCKVFYTPFTFLSDFVIWMQGFLHIIYIFEWLCHLNARFFTYHSHFWVTVSLLCRGFYISFTILSEFVIWMRGFLHIIHISEWLCHFYAGVSTHRSHFWVTLSFECKVFYISFTFLGEFVIWMQGFLHIIYIFEWLFHLFQCLC
jgi:hypothetical protein